MNKNKALIKSTGEVLDIKNEYATFTVDISFGSNYSDKILKKMFDSYKIDIDFKDAIDYTIDPNDIKIDSKNKSIEINKYVLSNGNSYSKSELIVGTENIRNSKLDNILQDGI